MTLGEFHLPGQHDQKKHGRRGRGTAAVRKPRPAARAAGKAAPPPPKEATTPPPPDTDEAVRDLMGQAYEFSDPATGLRTRWREGPTGDPDDPGDPFTASGKDWAARMQILDRDGRVVGEATRFWKRGPDGTLEARHEALEITDPTLRGGGFADRFNAHAEAVYRRQGFSRITLYANMDVGAYAWARSGYQFQASGDRYNLAFYFRNTPGLARNPAEAAEIERIAARLDDPKDPITPLDVAGWGRRDGETMWLGKRILLGAAWRGVKPLRESAMTASANTPAEVGRHHLAWSNAVAERIPARPQDAPSGGRGRTDYPEHHHDVSAPAALDDLFWRGVARGAFHLPGAHTFHLQGHHDQDDHGSWADGPDEPGRMAPVGREIPGGTGHRFSMARDGDRVELGLHDGSEGISTPVSTRQVRALAGALSEDLAHARTLEADRDRQWRDAEEAREGLARMRAESFRDPERVWSDDELDEWEDLETAAADVPDWVVVSSGSIGEFRWSIELDDPEVGTQVVIEAPDGERTTFDGADAYALPGRLREAAGG